jgi:hypothetical protein
MRGFDHFKYIVASMLHLVVVTHSEIGRKNNYKMRSKPRSSHYNGAN